MKTIFAFIIILLMGVFQLKAQELSEKIVIEKRGYKYNGISLDEHTVGELLIKNDQAYKMFKPAKFNGNFGYVLLSAGIGLMAAPLYPVIGGNKEDINRKYDATFIGIGAALTGISIPILRKASRQTKAAVELYSTLR